MMQFPPDAHAEWKRPKNLPSHSKPFRTSPAQPRGVGVFGFARPEGMFLLEGGTIAGNPSIDPRWGFVPLGVMKTESAANARAKAASKKAPSAVVFGTVPVGEWVLMPPPRDASIPTERALAALWAKLDLQRKQRLDAFEARQIEIAKFRAVQRAEIAQAMGGEEQQQGEGEGQEQ